MASCLLSLSSQFTLGQLPSHDDTQAALWSGPCDKVLRAPATPCDDTIVEADLLAPVKPSDACGPSGIVTATSVETLS